MRFRLGTAEYEIDLNAENASRFRSELEPFIDHARRLGTAQRYRPARPPSARKRSADIRAWAKEQGIQLSSRGRIPDSVTERYRAASKAR